MENIVLKDQDENLYNFVLTNIIVIYFDTIYYNNNTSNMRFKCTILLWFSKRITFFDLYKLFLPWIDVTREFKIGHKRYDNNFIVIIISFNLNENNIVNLIVIDVYENAHIWSILDAKIWRLKRPNIVFRGGLL